MLHPQNQMSSDRWFQWNAISFPIITGIAIQNGCMAMVLSSNASYFCLSGTCWYQPCLKKVFMLQTRKLNLQPGLTAAQPLRSRTFSCFNFGRSLRSSSWTVRLHTDRSTLWTLGKSLTIRATSAVAVSTVYVHKSSSLFQALQVKRIFEYSKTPVRHEKNLLERFCQYNQLFLLVWL